MNQRTYALRSQQIAYLYNNLPKALVAYIGIALISYLTISDYADKSLFNIWIFVAILITIFRAFMFSIYKKHPEYGNRFYYNLFSVGLVLSALSWGVTAFFVFEKAIEYQIFLVLMIGGLSSGSAVSTASRKEQFFMFSFISLTPYIVLFYSQGSTISLAIATSLLIYQVILVLIVKQVSENLNNNFSLSQQNSELITQLEQKVKEANSSVEAKSRFLSTMSHEIRTPLNAIIGFIKILKKGEDDPKKLGYLETIDHSSLMLLNILNDILDFSKIEAGELKISPVVFNPKKSFKTTFELFTQSAKDHKIEYRLLMDESVPESIYSDEFRLNQVISNLLSNAIKFTPEGKSVEMQIRFDSTRSRLEVVIKDQGIGIEEEKQKEIFREFVQADSSLTREYGGTGLGLSISKHILKLLDSELELESRPNEGSRFSFSVTVQTDHQKTQSAQSREEKRLFKGKKVLVAEDNMTNQMLIKILLEAYQIEVTMVKNGQEAVDRFKEELFDCVLMDINMPLKNGSDAMKEIKAYEKAQQHQSVAIVALTANATHGDKEKYLEMGFDAYIAKPIEMEALQNVLSESL